MRATRRCLSWHLRRPIGHQLFCPIAGEGQATIAPPLTSCSHVLALWQAITQGRFKGRDEGEGTQHDQRQEISADSRNLTTKVSPKTGVPRNNNGCVVRAGRPVCRPPKRKLLLGLPTLSI